MNIVLSHQIFQFAHHKFSEEIWQPSFCEVANKSVSGYRFLMGRVGMDLSNWIISVRILSTFVQRKFEKTKKGKNDTIHSSTIPFLSLSTSPQSIPFSWHCPWCILLWPGHVGSSPCWPGHSRPWWLWIGLRWRKHRHHVSRLPCTFPSILQSGIWGQGPSPGSLSSCHWPGSGSQVSP